MNARRLLVMDDNAEFRLFVRRVAEGEGFAVQDVAEMAELQDAYGRFEPTLIVLDIVMPETDGIEVLRWLGGRDCRARIFVVTGHNPHYAKLAARLGDTYGLNVAMLYKPLRAAMLRQALQQDAVAG